MEYGKKLIRSHQIYFRLFCRSKMKKKQKHIFEIYLVKETSGNWL